ncbi:MAG: hypothetical protein CSA49_01545 [Gammaproteobacteria bacterium]|nr:MAG: hypothetical protein CSA49_01545 [Gammaproteobacteria bacterium]
MAAQWYSAFAASSALSDIADQFLVAMDNRSPEPQAPLCINLLHLFMDEVLDSYFVVPMEMVSLNKMGRKVVNAGVNAIRTTSKLAITRVVKKMNNDELKPLADYIDSIIIRPAAGLEQPTYLAVPISSGLHERLASTINQGRTAGPRASAEEFSQALCGLIDESINQYFEIPVSMLKLGYVMEKIARVAMESGRAASHTVVKKVHHTMDDQELLAFFDFAESIVVEKPGTALA